MRVAFFENDIARYRALLVRELLTNSRHDFYFLANTKSKQPFRTVMGSGEFYGRFVRISSWEFGGFVFHPGLFRAAMSSKYDVFIIPPIVRFPLMWLAMVLGRLTGKRVLLFGHCWVRRDPAWIRWTKRMLYSVAHGYLLFGFSGRERGIELGIDPARLHVVYNSVPHDPGLKPDRKSMDLFLQRRFPGRHSLPVACVVTRLLPMRRIDVLLRAAAILESETQPVNLLIIGDGPMRRPLERLAAALKLTISFEGKSNEREVARAFAASHVSVCPGPIGLTAIHSVAYDTPVISYSGREGQPQESEVIIPGVTGDVFSRDDPADLARVLKRWLVDKKPSCGEMGKRLIERVYCAENQVHVIDKAIDSVCVTGD
jgi:glycosyltransferase involved in cell wall biosynthesis